MSAAIKVTTRVDIDPATAFEIFTDEIDRWWRRGPRFRFLTGREGALRFEPGAGGRLVEFEGDREYEVGRVRTWNPPEHLVFDFRARAFAPDEVTEVDVRFVPEAGGTRVTVEHRGWEDFPADHPVRHGLKGAAFDDMMGVWWADLIADWRTRAEGKAKGG